eukprot:g6531.t1
MVEFVTSKMLMGKIGVGLLKYRCSLHIQFPISSLSQWMSKGLIQLAAKAHENWQSRIENPPRKLLGNSNPTLKKGSLVSTYQTVSRILPSEVLSD